MFVVLGVNSGGRKEARLCLERNQCSMAVICSELPEEVVSMIVERVVCVDDLIRFGAVCKTWRSASIPEKEKKKLYSPLIMLAKADNDNLPTDNNDGEGVRSFLIPYHRNGDGNKKMRSFDIELPMAQGRRCWGSPYGWVVTIGLDLNISLLNPLTGAHLPLPPQPIPQEQYLSSKESLIRTSKLALGWYSSSQSWLVMAIFGIGEEVGFTLGGASCSSSSSSWTCIRSPSRIMDCILFQDRIFMVSHDGISILSDIKEETPPKVVLFESLPDDDDLAIRKLEDFTNIHYYLVEMGGNLLLVARKFDFVYDKAHTDYFVPPWVEQHYVTTRFLVWWFSFSRRRWYKLKDLGEYALFLGNNTSFALSTNTFPDFSRNSVYFADDHDTEYKYQFNDMGVYDFGERIVRPFDIANMGVFSKFSRPIFFMPTL